MSKKELMVILAIFILTAANLFAGGAQEEPQASPQAQMAQTEGRTPLELYNPGFSFPTEKIEIDYWSQMDIGGRPNYPTYYDKVLADYLAIHPNVRVNFRTLPSQKKDLLIQTAIQAGNLPDIFPDFISHARANDVINPAPEWVERYIEENYTDQVLKFMRADGKVWAVLGKEMQLGACYLFVNLDRFEESGLKDPPKTLPELVDAARKTVQYNADGTIKKPGYHMRFQGAKQYVGEKFLPFADAYLDSSKGMIFNENYTDIIIDSKAYIDTLELYQDMVFKWKLNDQGLPRPGEGFKLGISAMTNLSIPSVGQIQKSNPDLRYIIAPSVNGAPPYGNYLVGGHPSTQFDVIKKGTKHPDVIWDFLLFLRHDENDLLFIENMPSHPVQKKNLDAPILNTFAWYDVAKVMMFERPINYRMHSDPHSMYTEVLAYLGEAILAACTDPDVDPAEALKKAAAQAHAKL